MLNWYHVQPLDLPPQTRCLDVGSRPMSSSSSTPRQTWTEITTGCTSSTLPNWSSTLWTSTEVGSAWPPSVSVSPLWSSSTSAASLVARMWLLLWGEFPTKDTGPTYRQPCTLSTTSSSRLSRALGFRWGGWRLQSEVLRHVNKKFPEVIVEFVGMRLPIIENLTCSEELCAFEALFQDNAQQVCNWAISSSA